MSRLSHDEEMLSSSSSSSSSYYRASVANAPNVLQQYWLIVLPLNVPDPTASLLLWGPSGQRWRCLWTFLFSNVPLVVFKRSSQPNVELHGREIVDEFWLKVPNFQVTFRDLLHALNLRRKACWGFFRPEKSNGFGPVWTHELGYQRPARYL